MTPVESSRSVLLVSSICSLNSTPTRPQVLMRLLQGFWRTSPIKGVNTNNSILPSFLWLLRASFWLERSKCVQGDWHDPSNYRPVSLTSVKVNAGTYCPQQHHRPSWHAKYLIRRMVEVSTRRDLEFHSWFKQIKIWLNVYIDDREEIDVILTDF